MSNVKKSCICAFCIALCCVLPTAFHAVGLGAVFSPIHLPVLLCGLLCGGAYGAFCGIAGPLLSCLTTGMPSAARLIYMMPELCAYGLFCGLILRFVRTGRTASDLYSALVPSLILGRVVGGIARALFSLYNAESYTLALWVGAYFVETLPAVVLQLILLPMIVLVLMKARLIPARYGEDGSTLEAV